MSQPELLEKYMRIAEANAIGEVEIKLDTENWEQIEWLFEELQQWRSGEKRYVDNSFCDDCQSVTNSELGITSYFCGKCGAVK